MDFAKSVVLGAVSLGLLTAAAAGQCKSTQQASECSGSTAANAPVMVAASYRPEHAAMDIVDTAVAAGSFKTLAAALKAAGLVDALKGEGPFTVFAPTDEAFAKLPAGTVEELLKPANKARLASILKYHVVSGTVLAKDVKTGAAATLDGQRVDLVAKDGGVKVDGAAVTKADIECTNGVIHVIDTVILPSDKNVVQTAVAAGKFSTLAKLLTTAELVSTLEGDGPFTVFAPTDEAFAKLPKETVESLLKPENREKLVSILKYHVVSGRIYSDAAVKAGKASTLQGGSVAIKSEAGGVTINGAKVLSADIDATNGVIHVIDTVILPK
ncbi:MAG: fasciclin domain-containing protein [Phycisphaerales bacterium]|nr:fasciclin domain-containing protein [Phycisphaerales bacterium]